jgi:nucleoside-diphosphate-sugar epimerases
MINNIVTQDMEDIYSGDVLWEKLNGKTILLTGAYGMLASYLVYFLVYIRNQKNVNVNLIAVVRDRNKFFSKFSNIGVLDNVTVIENDISKPLDISEQIDYIIHAASLASPQYYGICPVDVLMPNTIGTYYLLQLARRKKVKSFLLFSTCDVYGEPNTINGMITETAYGKMDTLDIHNCYSESKRMAETMCKAFNVQYGVPTKIARIAHTYAPTMDIDDDPRVFASFVKDIVSGHDIVMKSDGMSKRSFCYITDAIVGYFMILFKGVDGEAYNVCNTSQFVSIKELAEILVSIYPEKKLKVVQKERQKSEHYIENNLLVGCDCIPDNSKLMRLGWNAKVDIKTGFKRVIDIIGNV